LSAEAQLPLLNANPQDQTLGEKGTPVPRQTPGKLLGLLFGGLVVAVMLFMMFVLLGNLFTRE